MPDLLSIILFDAGIVDNVSRVVGVYSRDYEFHLCGQASVNHLSQRCNISMIPQAFGKGQLQVYGPFMAKFDPIHILPPDPNAQKCLFINFLASSPPPSHLT